MDYQAKIDKIESELDELKDAVKSATRDERIVIRNQIIALETKSSNLFLLILQQNATAGNSHSI
jgi:cell division protein FtsL